MFKFSTQVFSDLRRSVSSGNIFFPFVGYFVSLSRDKDHRLTNIDGDSMKKALIGFTRVFFLMGLALVAPVQGFAAGEAELQTPRLPVCDVAEARTKALALIDKEFPVDQVVMTEAFLGVSVVSKGFLVQLISRVSSDELSQEYESKRLLLSIFVGEETCEVEGTGSSWLEPWVR
ncbi:MAG: hypothetical protein WCH11_06890 [Bdellovibrio sp.]